MSYVPQMYCNDLLGVVYYVFTVEGGGGQGFFDNRTKASEKNVTMGGGGKKWPKLRDAIMDDPLFFTEAYSVLKVLTSFMDVPFFVTALYSVLKVVT